MLRAVLNMDRDRWGDNDGWLKERLFWIVEEDRVARALARERRYAQARGLAFPVKLLYRQDD